MDREEIIRTIKEMKKSGSTDKEIKSFLEQMDLSPELIEQLMDVASASLLEEEEAFIEKNIEKKLDEKLRDFENEFYDNFEERMKIEKNNILSEVDDILKKIDKKYYEKISVLNEKTQHLESKVKDLETDISEMRKDWEIFAWTSTRIRNLISYICIGIGIVILIYYAWYIISDPNHLIMNLFTSGDIKKVVSALIPTIIIIMISTVLLLVGYYLPRRK